MLRCFDSSGTHLLHLLPLLVLLWPASAAPTPHVALSAPAGASVRPAARKAPVATLGADPSSDRVELVGGTTHGGRVLYEDDEVVILKQDEHVRTFVRDKVRRVDTRETRLGEVLDRMASLEDHEFPELIELGHRAHELGLPGEGELVFLRILLTDPFNEEARHALGHKRVGKAWRVPYKDDWLPLSKVRKLREEWNDGWVFETAHYVLHTNTDLETAVNTALDLEIAYRAFYEVLGQPLGLHQVEGKLAAHVHADVESLPLLKEGVSGIFDAASNTLIVDASWKMDRGLLIHEATHQLIHNTHEGMRKGAYEVPLWLNEGLAEFMQVGLAVKPRTYRFDWGEYSERHVRAQLVARKLPTLEELLNFRTADFVSNRKRLSYALAYNLVDFCMNADSGLRQDELMNYLAESYKTKVESEDFLTMVAKDPEGFRTEWAVYIEEFMQPLNIEKRRLRGRGRGR